MTMRLRGLRKYLGDTNKKLWKGVLPQSAGVWPTPLKSTAKNQNINLMCLLCFPFRDLPYKSTICGFRRFFGWLMNKKNYSALFNIWSSIGLGYAKCKNKFCEHPIIIHPFLPQLSSVYLLPSLPHNTRVADTRYLYKLCKCQTLFYILLDIHTYIIMRLRSSSVDMRKVYSNPISTKSDVWNNPIKRARQ